MSTQKISNEEVNARYNEFNSDTPKVFHNGTSLEGLIYESIQKWFNREAEKYGKNVNIPLSLYPEQIKISDCPATISTFFGSKSSNSNYEKHFFSACLSI